MEELEILPFTTYRDTVKVLLLVCDTAPVTLNEYNGAIKAPDNSVHWIPGYQVVINIYMPGYEVKGEQNYYQAAEHRRLHENYLDSFFRPLNQSVLVWQTMKFKNN